MLAMRFHGAFSYGVQHRSDPFLQSSWAFNHDAPQASLHLALSCRSPSMQQASLVLLGRDLCLMFIH